MLVLGEDSAWSAVGDDVLESFNWLSSEKAPSLMRVIASRMSLLQSSRTVWFLFTSVIFHLVKIIEWTRVFDAGAD
jgi:hypothetical protein